MTDMIKKITINADYTHAVNIERDGGGNRISEYILTDNARRLLQIIADNMKKKEAHRSWSLIGPYGTGKSAFSLYLSSLLSAPASKSAKTAQVICQKKDSQLAKDFKGFSKSPKGLCSVFLTGSREPMSYRLITQLAIALENHLPNNSAAKKSLAKVKGNVPTSTVVQLILKSAAAIKEAGGDGLLLIVDEMGKFLEYDADHSDSDNTYLLQSLAELTLRRKSEDAHILFLGILHQGFEFYSRGLSREIRAEWTKVQGRFPQLSFIESPEQMLRLTARVIQHSFNEQEKKTIHQAIKKPANVLYEANFFSDKAFYKSGEDLFFDCYPLHPVSAAFLVLLTEKIGQNERTLFSYLAGTHPHSFVDSVNNLSKVGDFILPWTLFDYFLANGFSSTANPLINRRWAEINNVMQRLGENAPAQQVQMLKTIALFNLVGAKGDFTASLNLLSAVFPEKEAKEAKAAINTLIKNSLIVYRKYGNEYRVWQGSDFDLETTLQREIDKMAGFQLAEEINQNVNFAPIIARKHAIETGNLRHLSLLFVDENNHSERAIKAGDLRLVIYLAKDGKGELPKKIRDRYSNDDLFTVSRNVDKLENIIKERRGLEKIINMPELKGDPIAKDEAKIRLTQITRMERKLVSILFAPSDNRIFYWRDDTFHIKNLRELQNVVSRVADDIYNKSPRIVNELINRDKPSTQAVAARNKLLFALRFHANKKELGIKKYPPEKGMYLSLLKETELHRFSNKCWALHAPKKEEDKYNFFPLWVEIENLLESSKLEARSFSQLDNKLCAPPYGIKRGVLPIFYAMAIFLNEGEIAIYEDGLYTPFFESPHLERFFFRPETFAFKRFKVEGISASLLKAYQNILGGKKRKGGDLLAITRPLLRQIAGLPDYAKKTERTSEITRKFYRAISHSKSPMDMLLLDIPKSLGFLEDTLHTSSTLDEFSKSLIKAMGELEGAFPLLLGHFCELFAQGLGLEKDFPLNKVRQVLSSRVIGLERYTVDKEGLIAFFKQAQTEAEDDNAWLTKMMLLFSGKNPERWEDADCNRAEYKLAEYIRRMADLEGLRVWEKKGSGAGSFLLVRIVSEKGEQEKMLRLEKTAQAEKMYQKIQDAVTELPSENRLPILASMLQSEMEKRITKTLPNRAKIRKDAK